MQPIVDDKRNIYGGIGALKLSNDAHGLIADVVDAAHDLNPAGIVLKAKALQVCVQPRLHAMQRFQNCNKWFLRRYLALSLPAQMPLDLAACK